MESFDFESELTSTRSPDIYVKLSILSRRYDLLSSFKAWRKNQVDRRLKNTVIANIETLYYDLEASLKRRYNKLGKKNEDEKKLYDDLFLMLGSAEDLSDEQVIKAISILNLFLDRVKLTLIDTKKEYDRTNIEAENYEKGL